MIKVTTLESILELRNKHHLYHDFILYLQNTWCLENLLFYQDVQDFRQLKKHLMIKKYHTMIHTYIVVNAIQEINIPCDMRESLLNIKDGDIHSAVFDEIAESILELIRVNSYLPWSYQFDNNQRKGRRNTLTPSLSVPEHRWQHLFSSSRTSFTSLRDVDTTTTTNQQKMVGLFQRKRQAIMIRVKKTFILDNNNNNNTSFSWLAKK